MLHSRARRALGALACCGLLALGGCGREGPAAAADASKGAAKGAPPPATVAVAIEREVRESEELAGRLEAIESVEVRARVSGVLTSVDFQAGREVKKGDLLFTIDARPFAVELARAEAEAARVVTRAELAKIELARSEKLLASKAISQQEFDERTSANREGEASVRSARAAVEVARLNLEYTRVVAPIGGRIGRAEVTTGNWVNGGSVGANVLTTIVSLDPIYAYFEADEAFYLRTRETPGGAIRLGLSNEDGFPHTGRIEFVDNRLDPKTGTIRVRAVFPNRERRLVPGLYARLKLPAGKPYQAVLVSDRAVGTDQNQKFVLVAGADNMLQYRSVKLGPLIDGMRVIRDGLKPGEQVVVNGLQRVRPGMPVTPKIVPMTAEPPPPDSSAEPPAKPPAGKA